MSHTAPCVPRPPGLRRAAGTFAAALLTAGLGCIVVAPARAAEPAVPATQPLVVLLHDHVARTGPYARAPRITSVAGRRPLTRVRTVLPVVAGGAGAWVRVRLPGRPNGRKGWIRTDGTRRTSTEWHITLRLSTRRVTAYRDGRAERHFRAVVGAPSTPTPRGHFFIEEAVALPGHAGGPFALAASARSQVLQEFAGGPGQIALHGTDGLAGRRGSAVSHGCIRLGTRAMTWLARRIGGGVPLTVRR